MSFFRKSNRLSLKHLKIGIPEYSEVLKAYSVANNILSIQLEKKQKEFSQKYGIPYSESVKYLRNYEFVMQCKNSEYGGHNITGTASFNAYNKAIKELEELAKKGAVVSDFDEFKLDREVLHDLNFKSASARTNFTSLRGYASGLASIEKLIETDEIKKEFLKNMEVFKNKLYEGIERLEDGQEILTKIKVSVKRKLDEELLVLEKKSVDIGISYLLHRLKALPEDDPVAKSFIEKLEQMLNPQPLESISEAKPSPGVSQRSISTTSTPSALSRSLSGSYRRLSRSPSTPKLHRTLNAEGTSDFLFSALDYVESTESQNISNADSKSVEAQNNHAKVADIMLKGYELGMTPKEMRELEKVYSEGLDDIVKLKAIKEATNTEDTTLNATIVKQIGKLEAHLKKIDDVTNKEDMQAAVKGLKLDIPLVKLATEPSKEPDRSPGPGRSPGP